MKKDLHFIVNMKVFPVDVLVNIGSTEEQVLQNIKEIGYKLCEEEKKTLQGEFQARTVILKNNSIIITFKKITNGLLSHEIYHAICMIMHSLGIIYSQESEEVFAYAMQYLTDEIYRVAGKNKTKMQLK